MSREGFRDKVKEATDIVELIGATTRLQAKGNLYWGLCPFHKEKSPSFTVNPDRASYYCFGCQKNGDVFSFIQETENLDFPQAVERLAQMAGIPLEDFKQKNEKTARTPLEALSEAQKFYHSILLKTQAGEACRQYLKGRGFTSKDAIHFGLGFAPPRWDSLYQHLKKKGFSIDVLVRAELIKNEGQNKTYDRFRGRLMIPIQDTRGQVVGFGSRVLDQELPIVTAKEQKYFNTPENNFFKKRQILFHLNKARRVAKTTNSLILAEGYMDVMAFHRAGLLNSVAGMGTALSEEQVDLLARHSQIVMLAYDQDPAGQAALHKSAVKLLEKGLDARVVVMPPGMDPDDVLRRQGKDHLIKIVQENQPYLIFRIHQAMAEPGSEAPERQLGLIRTILDLVQLVKEPTSRQAVIKEMARKVPLTDEKALNQELWRREKKRIKNPGSRFKTGVGSQEFAKGPPAYGPEGLVLACAVTDPEAFLSLQELEEGLFKNELYRKVYKILKEKVSFDEIRTGVDSRGSDHDNTLSAFVRRVDADADLKFKEVDFREQVQRLGEEFLTKSLADPNLEILKQRLAKDSKKAENPA